MKLSRAVKILGFAELFMDVLPDRRGHRVVRQGSKWRHSDLCYRDGRGGLRPVSGSIACILRCLGVQ